MVNSCCVKGCHNKQDRETDRRYYSIPTVVSTQGKEMEELTTRRRREWLAQLRLKDLTFESNSTWRTVCSDHFVNECDTDIGMAELEDAMAELEDGTLLDETETLQESEDVRHIKEEWTKLQAKAFWQRKGMMQVADMAVQSLRNSKSLEGNLSSANDENNIQPHPTGLPSLESIVGHVPSIPSMEVSAGYGKKLLASGAVRRQLGVCQDSQDLEPQKILLEKASYHFGAATPTQTDIRWSSPANARNFKSLTYSIEIDCGHGWKSLTDSSLPILRAYFTSDKIIVGRYSRAQEVEPVALRLRIRAAGTPAWQNLEETVHGPWSEEIWLYIEGSVVISSTVV